MGQTDNQIITVHCVKDKRNCRYRMLEVHIRIATNTIEGNGKGYTEKTTSELTRRVYKYFSSWRI